MGSDVLDKSHASDVRSLINFELIARAQEMHDAEMQRHDAAIADLAAAEADVARAAGLLPALTARAVAGGDVSVGDVATARAARLDAEHYRDFCREVERQLGVAADRAAEVVRTTIAVAHQPVMDEGIALRIRAAVRADQARAGKQLWHVDPAEMDSAKACFEEGNRLIALAESKGCQSRRSRSAVLPPPWPTTEAVERLTWRREARA